VVPTARTLVVLEAVTNADNVGSVFRNAAAFGADAVLAQSKPAAIRCTQGDSHVDGGDRSASRSRGLPVAGGPLRDPFGRLRHRRADTA